MFYIDVGALTFDYYRTILALQLFHTLSKKPKNPQQHECTAAVFTISMLLSTINAMASTATCDGGWRDLHLSCNCVLSLF